MGSLVSFDWKLGVAVKSNKCEQLNTPFVAINLKVEDTNNVISDHSFELTIPEFYVCIYIYYYKERKKNKRVNEGEGSANATESRCGVSIITGYPLFTTELILALIILLLQYKIQSLYPQKKLRTNVLFFFFLFFFFFFFLFFCLTA